MDKLSTRSSSKEESSLSPHHVMSSYNYANINTQMPKDSHPDCVLKCTCNSSSYTSLKSPKSNSGEHRNIKIAKISCDASTSPGRHISQKSPQNNFRLRNSKDTSSPKYNDLCISDDKKIITKTASPRRLVQTRNAATSPHLDIRKQLSPKLTQQHLHYQQQLQYQHLQQQQALQCQLSPPKQHCNELLPKTPELSTKLLLEKSNSLGEKKPTRPLRTTRSLSPRPPVRHQHAIMVSDENDIMTVKISPNEEYDDELNENQMGSPIITKFHKERHKAQSEQTSPNLSDFETKFVYDCSITNKSTGCLVYVPSDPWLKMSDIDGKYNIINDGASTAGSKRKCNKMTKEIRSLSRGNLPQLDNDPWVWRKPPDNNGKESKSGAIKLKNPPMNSNNNRVKSPKQDIYQQRKSFSTTKFEISSSDFLGSKSFKNLLVETGNRSTSTASQQHRPKLQRSKSPVMQEDDTSYLTETILPPPPCLCNQMINEKTSNLLLSPRKENVEEIFISSPPATQSNASSTTTSSASTINATSGVMPSAANKTFLSVINPNLMQSRHSFSSASRKDDELQLNIRRLSEQMKHSSVTSSSTGADFTDYLSQFRNSNEHNSTTNLSASNAVVNARNLSKNPEPVLETTC